MAARSDASAQLVASFSENNDVVATMSSQHVWDTLVHLLYITMQPLANSTTIVDDVLFVVLGSTTDKRRSIGILDNQECLNRAYHLLFQPSDVALKSSMMDMGVERGVYQWFIDNYLQHAYRPSSSGIELLYEDDPLRTYVAEMYELYINFRLRVVDRFSRLIKSQATKETWARLRMGLATTANDTENNYYLAVIRSIDKFHPGEGTLGGYVGPWLQNAGSSKFTMYTGEAFGLSRPIRKMIHDGKLAVNNKAYSLELAEGLPDELVISESSDSLHRMFQAMRLSSQMCFVMGLYNFPTCLTTEEVQHLRLVNVGSEFNDNQPIEDLPTLMPLSRASRKQSEQSDRRKMVISSSIKRKPRKHGD